MPIAYLMIPENVQDLPGSDFLNELKFGKSLLEFSFCLPNYLLDPVHLLPFLPQEILV